MRNLSVMVYIYSAVSPGGLKNWVSTAHSPHVCRSVHVGKNIV